MLRILCPTAWLRPDALLVPALLVCACGPGAAPDAPPSAPTAPPVQRALSQPENDKLPWRSVWPADGGGAVRALGVGRLLGPKGTEDHVPGPPCGPFTRAPAGAVLWLPPGPPILFPPSPLVGAAVVEKSTWRLSEVLGPNEGIQPGADAKDPAIDRGVRVRSVRKIRRQGPPWQVIVGERRDKIAVAFADKDADKLVNGLVFQVALPGPFEIASLPVEDLDGAPGSELVVYGDGPSGSFRVVFAADLESGALRLLSFEEQARVTCPEAG